MGSGLGKIRSAVGAVVGASLLLASGFGSAWAQGAITGPPPIHSEVDANGVDLISGNLNVSTTDVTVGQGAGALAYARTFIGSGWTDNLTGTVSGGPTSTVSLGAKSEIFNDNNFVYNTGTGAGLDAHL